MTFLLLFRSISKIKIGNIAEVETREAIRVSLNSLTKTLEAIDYTIKPLPSELTDNKNIGNAKDQLSEANEGIKAARDLLRNQD